MNYRAELVRLISDGTRPADIVDFFLQQGMHLHAVNALLSNSGVIFARRKDFNDGISDERRLELQELSTRID